MTQERNSEFQKHYALRKHIGDKAYAKLGNGDSVSSGGQSNEVKAVIAERAKIAEGLRAQRQQNEQKQPNARPKGRVR